MDSIVIIDFGSQYSQLIARRVRECNVFCVLLPYFSDQKEIIAHSPKGFILSGGPASIYEDKAPQLPPFILHSKKPILGICYGMQALTHSLGGLVSPSSEQEYGHAVIEHEHDNPILSPESQSVWMSHGDRVDSIPEGFSTLASTENSPISAIGDMERGYYGVQFHPEVHHTTNGLSILKKFVIDVCKASPDWTSENIIKSAVKRIKKQVGNHKVLSAVSGGVDSTVATTLVSRAIGNQLSAVFVDNGLLRLNEVESVKQILRDNVGVDVAVENAVDEFLHALMDVVEPEKKRKIIGEKFIDVFKKQSIKLGAPKYLVQGTIYPDVIESSTHGEASSHKIKTHHNVGGLPENLEFKLIEPLRNLFKDEVRAIGEALGLPIDLVWRQPFPGPGLAIRCIGEVTRSRLTTLRSADAIVTQELSKAKILNQKNSRGDGSVSQAFAILLPIKSVGVMGDRRTYQEVIVLRAVSTDDFMTADWARLPAPILARIANRIVNEVEGVNRVLYDITSKPPATIEWE